jgi:hypothetical protein
MVFTLGCPNVGNTVSDFAEERSSCQLRRSSWVQRSAQAPTVARPIRREVARTRFGNYPDPRSMRLADTLLLVAGGPHCAMQIGAGSDFFFFSSFCMQGLRSRRPDERPAVGPRAVPSDVPMRPEPDARPHARQPGRTPTPAAKMPETSRDTDSYLVSDLAPPHSATR